METLISFAKEMRPIANILGALSTPLIAIFVAYIAYEQWEVNKRRDERESRERRIAIYKRVRAHLDYIDSTREVDPELYRAFCDAEAEADFVFPMNVLDFLSEISSDSFQWLTSHEDISNAAPDADASSLQRLERENEDLIDALQGKNCELRTTFERHM